MTPPGAFTVPDGRFGGIRRLLRFVVVGGSSTALYFCLLLALEGVVAQVSLLTIICYAVSMAFNYVAQARYTFRAKAASGLSIRRFFAMHATAMALNATAMSLLVGGGLPLIAAQLLVTAILTVMTFLTLRHWVFASADE